MKLTVLGSSSAGNGYALTDNEGNTLLIEAGTKLFELKKALGFNTRGVLGCLISHRHGDHIKYADQYLDAGINVYTHPENGLGGHRFKELKNKVEIKIGPWVIKPFDLFHDVPTYGFLLDHEESGLTCFITDTAYCKYRFPGLCNVIIEANYSREILMRRFERGEIHAVVKDRVFKSHLSFENMLEFLNANDLSKVNKIVLIHLSEGNADPDQFRKRTREFTGKTVEIAGKGIELELNKNPF